jgi:hypothetical protein
VRTVVASGQDGRSDLGFGPIGAGAGGRTVPRHPLTARPETTQMPEQTTVLISQTTTDQPWDRRPALTLLAVIVAWYVGTIGVVLTQAF